LKAVVVEIKKNYAAVLSDRGCIVTVKNKQYEVGQIIQIQESFVPISRRAGIFAASAAAAFVILGSGVWAYASPYSYVSMDVNPSIEFTVNRFDRVLNVKGVNDDGERILDKISLKNLKNKTIETALNESVDQISDAGYFDGNTEGGIVIAASSKNTGKAAALAADLKDSVTQEAKENGDSIEVEAFSVSREEVKEARELGVTPGKLNLIEKLKETAGDNSQIDMKEWIDKPVKDIMKATKDYKKTVGNSNSLPADKNIQPTPAIPGKDNNKTEPGQAKENSGPAITNTPSRNETGNTNRGSDISDASESAVKKSESLHKPASSKSISSSKQIDKATSVFGSPDGTLNDTASDRKEGKSNTKLPDRSIKNNDTSKSSDNSDTVGADQQVQAPEPENKVPNHADSSEASDTRPNYSGKNDTASSPNSNSKDNSENKTHSTDQNSASVNKMESDNKDKNSASDNKAEPDNKGQNSASDNKAEPDNKGQTSASDNKAEPGNKTEEKPGTNQNTGENQSNTENNNSSNRGNK
jgi:hypothetical protein